MTVNPRHLAPGTRIRYRNFPPQVDQRLKERKDDDTGWWLSDGSGLADTAFMSGDWAIVYACALCGGSGHHVVPVVSEPTE